MNCKDCPRYHSVEKRCLDGKLNPPTWEMAVTASQAFGLRAICPLNDFKERLVGCKGHPLAVNAKSRPAR